MVFDLTIIFIAHYIFDFLLQPRSWAKTKHKDLIMLMAHCAVYQLGIILTGWLIFGNMFDAANFGMINGLLHFVVDFFSSKLSHKYMSSGQGRHLVYTYGADQLLHQLSLIFTYAWIGGLW